MQTSSLLHFAFRARDPDALGFFYADLFDGQFFLHPVMTGMGIVVVKLGHPEAFFRGLLEFWPWNVTWDAKSAVFRRVACDSSRSSYGHMAIKVEGNALEVMSELESRGIRYNLEPRAPFAGLFVPTIQDPEGNMIEIFPAVDDMPIPEGSLCPPSEAAERIALLRRKFADRSSNQQPEPGFALIT